MTWQVALVIVLASLVLAGATTLGILLAFERRRANAAEQDAERWRGRYQESADAAARLGSVAENKELTDEQAAEKLHTGIAGWSAVDPSGDSADADDE